MSKIKILKKVIIFCILVSLLLISCKFKERSKTDYRNINTEDIQKTFMCFDTECTIKVSNSSKDTSTYVDEIINKFYAYDKMFSKTDIESEIYKINHRISDEIITYPEVADLFSIAKELYEWSEQKFDVSAGFLFELWDVKNRKVLPDDTDIDKAISNSGDYNYSVIVNNDNGEKSAKIVFNNKKKVQYDFGALVKGYVCNEIRQKIYNDGIIENALINLGGNVCCIGENWNRDDKMYRVGIYKPFSNYDIAETVSVIDKCVITSGNYQRYFKVEGDNRIYHHIINPKTGYPTDNGIDSVTIISKNGLLGDYLSTTSMLLGENKARDLIEQCKDKFNDDSIKAIFIYSDGKISK